MPCSAGHLSVRHSTVTSLTVQTETHLNSLSRGDRVYYAFAGPNLQYGNAPNRSSARRLRPIRDCHAGHAGVVLPATGHPSGCPVLRSARCPFAKRGDRRRRRQAPASPTGTCGVVIAAGRAAGVLGRGTADSRDRPGHAIPRRRAPRSRVAIARAGRTQAGIARLPPHTRHETQCRRGCLRAQSDARNRCGRYLAISRQSAPHATLDIKRSARP